MTPAKEGDVVRAILDAYAGHPRIELWRNNTGQIRKGQRVIRFGRVGSADITGIIEGGRRIEIECKKQGNRTAKDRIEKQAEFASMIRKRGGIYILAFSVDDVKSILEGI